MFMYIFETEQGNKRVREKSDIKFLYWKETSYGDTKETWRLTALSYISCILSSLCVIGRRSVEEDSFFHFESQSHVVLFNRISDSSFAKQCCRKK